jgi:hypothetical protein
MAIELVKILRAHEAEETHAQLQQPFCDMVHRRTVEILGRECLGDNDENFYAVEQSVVEGTWNRIESELANILVD